MKLRDKNKALLAMALVALATPQATARADDTAAEIRSLKARLKQLEPLKEQLRRLEEKVSRQDHQIRGVAKSPAMPPAPETPVVCKDGPCPEPPPPVFVSFTNGLKVESFDQAFSFKIGGRVFVDGGVASQPETGKSGNANLTSARLQVEGKAFRYWDYKFQYDFAGSTPITSLPGTSTTVVGGIRDAYLALKYPALAIVPFTSEPLVLQVGNFYEPMGLERTNSKNYTDFIERALVSDALAPSRHIGFAAFARGKDWTAKGGIFTTSPEDRALTPSPGIPPFAAIPTAVATGGGQYFDVAGRVTYAPVKEKDALLHFGSSGRYHQPNDSTGLNNDRVMLVGNNVRTEANVLGINHLGTPDLSCGVLPSETALAARAVAGKCVSDVWTYGAELAAAYGPFSLQAEYLGAQYNRNSNALAFANLNGAGGNGLGGTSLNFSGYYVYGTWYLTGESRAESYKVDDYNQPATFGQINILNPLSKGGIGAWELAARFSELNLNSGGINGGSQQDITIGLNWYPDKGIRFMANYINVVQLAAPFNRPYLNGAHPNIFLMRAQVNW